MLVSELAKIINIEEEDIIKDTGYEGRLEPTDVTTILGIYAMRGDFDALFVLTDMANFGYIGWEYVYG